MNAVSTFDVHQTAMIVGVVLGLVVLSGLLVVLGRRWIPTGETDRGLTASLIRSWIAVVLVGSVVLFCGLSFGLSDGTLRNTLIGGLLASAGSAVAFYFASKASDQARHDILAATNNTTVWVPDLRGLSVGLARTLLAAAPLALQVNPGATDTMLIKTQQQAPNSQLTRGSTVVVDAG